MRLVLEVHDVVTQLGRQLVILGGDRVRQPTPHAQQLFLATLTGHGRVWLQSLPFSRLADRITPTGSSQDEGSVIGGISTLFER